MLCKIISANATIANILHRARMPWVSEHSWDSLVVGDDEDPGTCGAASHVLDVHEFLRFGITLKKTNIISVVVDVDSTDVCRVARICFGTGGRCSAPVSNQGHPSTSTSCSAREGNGGLSPKVSWICVCAIRKWTHRCAEKRVVKGMSAGRPLSKSEKVFFHLSRESLFLR